MPNIVMLSSSGPGNTKTVWNFSKSYNDIKLVSIVSDVEFSPSREFTQTHGIEFKHIPFLSSLEINGKYSEIEREKDCSYLLDYLTNIESKHGEIDCIVLAFQKILVGTVLTKYRGRMINVHPADLSICINNTAERKYIGLDGFKKNFEDREQSRTTVHFVDESVDSGEIITLGPSITLNKSRSARWNEKVQKIYSDRVALRDALEKFFNKINL